MTLHFTCRWGRFHGVLQQKSAREPGWVELNERYDSDSLKILRILLSSLERYHRSLAAAGLL